MKGNEMIDPYASIDEVSAQIRDRTVSPVAVVDACLARIDALNPRLNAFITVLADPVRSAAQTAHREIEAGRWRGPLHGIPVAVKDFYDTAGVKTTAAFERFANRVPAKDAVVVRRLKEAGAIVMGKTNMDALGMDTTGLTSFYGPVKNPWNVDYIAGGSSSGSAVAVASGMCYATVDTDAIGSCRLPAACCGVVGFKGTYGLISTEGILAGEPPPDDMIVWFSHPGVMTRRVIDTALVLDVLKESRALSRPVDFAHELNDPKRLRVGVATNFKADAAVVATFRKAVETVTGLGYNVQETNVTFAGPTTGIQHIERDRRAVSAQLFREIDVVLLPTTATTAPRVADAKPQALSAQNTVFANYYGLPAMTLPCGFDSGGLPIGLQIVGKSSGDVDVLSLGQQYERAGGWLNAHPTVS
jgi:aspartyl-tRNA(Asn)/glutamyl-tRNA(Gln) amidotransferase subunit A